MTVANEELETILEEEPAPPMTCPGSVRTPLEDYMYDVAAAELNQRNTQATFGGANESSHMVDLVVINNTQSQVGDPEECFDST